MILFTRDESLSEMLQRSASRPLQAVADVSALRGMLDSDRVDAVLVDCDGHGDGHAALKAVSASQANRQTPCVAITDAQTAYADARDLGGWLVVEKTALWKKPQQIEDWLAGVQKRHHKRFSRRMNGSVDSGPLMGRQMSLVNISLGGAAFDIHGASELEPHLTLRLAAHRLRCELIWRDSRGRVGVRFLPDQINEAELQQLVNSK
jgi:PilZ domain-containing protein